MLTVTGYSSLLGVVPEKDFENRKKSSRRYYRKFRVHIKLSKPRKPKKLAVLPGVLPLVHNRVTTRTAVCFLPGQ